MNRRLSLALGASALLFAPASLAVKGGTTVDEPEVREVKVPKVPFSKDGVDEVSVPEPVNKPVKVGKVATETVTAEIAEPKPVKAGRVSLDGLEYAPKKPSPADDEIVTQSAQSAEQQVGPAGPDEGSRQPTATRAGNVAAGMALASALAAGESHEQAQADSQAARERVKQDYQGGAADAGATDAGVSAPPTEGPEVLEAPAPAVEATKAAEEPAEVQ